MSSSNTTNWVSLVALVLVVVLMVRRSGSRNTKLAGPPRGSVFFGQLNNLINALDRAALIQEEWAEKYGSVFYRPAPFGKKIVTLMDPKAIAHFYAGGETTFQATSFARRAIGDLVGHGILSAEGNDHKRQRRAMTSGFTNAKMREYTSVFFESAHKVKNTWDQQFESKDSIDINITPWMNAISLDSMGNAGFSYDFGATNGHMSGVGNAFIKLLDLGITLSTLLVLVLQPVFPFVTLLPTERRRRSAGVKEECGIVAKRLLKETKEAEAKGNKADEKSVLGLLVKAQSAETGFPMSEEEINSLMRTLMLAGYLTTSIAMTWGLIELAKNPELQSKLRAEIRQKFPSSDPTWDQLNQDLPLLDAVVHETLRLHPTVIETLRQASKDDVIPLSQPLTLPDGSVTDQIFVEAGTLVLVPIAATNLRRSLWGDDAHEFKPERWLNSGEGISAGAKELQGHRHLLTFINGPRTCLGKGFALAEFKAAFSVLIRNFVFEFATGPETKVEKVVALIPRPTVVGEPDSHIPMRIRQVE